MSPLYTSESSCLCLEPACLHRCSPGMTSASGVSWGIALEWWECFFFPRLCCKFPTHRHCYIRSVKLWGGFLDSWPFLPIAVVHYWFHIHPHLLLSAQRRPWFFHHFLLNTLSEKTRDKILWDISTESNQRQWEETTSLHNLWNIPQIYLQLGVQLQEARFSCCDKSDLEMQIDLVWTALIARNGLNTASVIGSGTNVTSAEDGGGFGSCGGPAWLGICSWVATEHSSSRPSQTQQQPSIFSSFHCYRCSGPYKWARLLCC